MRVRLKQQRLAELIAASGLTQNHWAIKIGLSRGHWSGVVNGTHPFPSARTRTRILEAFNVPFEELFEIDATGEAWVDLDFRRAIADRFIIDAEVGQGGMGAVYLARDARHGRLVAIKVIASEAVSGIGLVQFQREISNVAKLVHPHTLPLHESGEVAGQPYFVMPYVRDGSLRSLLERKGRLSTNDALPIIHGVAASLDDAHREHILHCDIKPENILLHGAHAWVTDFGIARRIHTETRELPRNSNIDSSAGTPAYVSPEQAAGHSDLDARSDVYSLGCVAYEMLSGRPPFQGSNTLQIVSRRFVEPPPPLRDFAPDVPSEVEVVIARAMSLKREARPLTAGAFAQELADACAVRTGGVAAFGRAAWGGVSRVQQKLQIFPRHPIGGLVNQIVSDVRFAARTFRRRPALFASVALTIALGVGASSAMFSVIDHVLLRPLPYRAPEELVAVYPTNPSLVGHPTLGDIAERGTYSWIEFWELRAKQRTLTDIAGFEQGGGTMTPADGPAEQLTFGVASPNLVNVLGVSPILGSVFDTAAAPSSHVIMLGENFWQRRYGARRDVIGQTLRLGDTPYQIIGVLPAAVSVVTVSADVWLPRYQRANDVEGRGNHSGLTAIGRLKKGVTPSQAKDDMSSVMVASAPAEHEKHRASVYPLLEDRTEGVRSALVVLQIASAVLMLAACANVAAILLGSGLERRQEIAMRAALGASRNRLTRQLLTESFVLAAAGGVGGIAIAWVATRLLLMLAPLGVPRIASVSVDFRTLLAALALAAACGVVFGLAPALSLVRGAALHQSTRGSTTRMGFGQTSVVVGQIALATVLLVGGALLARTLVALNHVNTGFRAENLLAARLSPPFYKFRDYGDSANTAIESYYQRIIDEVRAMPGVVDVAMTSVLPLTSDRGNNDVVPEGWAPNTHEMLVAERRFVSGNYFGLMGIRILDGRAFTADDDRINAPQTMIISEGLAKHVWPNESAVGKKISFWGRDPSLVVGVAANVNDESLESATGFAYYVPAHQLSSSGPAVGNLLIRTKGTPASIAAGLRERIWGIDRAIAVPMVMSYDQILATEVSQQRFRARLMGVFCTLATLFAAMGVYGVMSRSVARRTREIGVRVALGAEPRQLLGSVMRQAVVLAVAGGVIGVGVGLASGRAIERLLYGVKADDPLNAVLVAALMCAVAAAAAFFPGRRASRVSPMVALRAE